MFNSLFESKKVMEPQPSQKEIIQEIHDTFYTEVDRLLVEAGVRKSEDIVKTSELEKAEKLRQLGFTQAESVRKLAEKEEQLEKVKRENNKKQELTEAIQYFSVKYPQYKFITEESVKKICEKYNLVYAPVDRYIGDVPEKNLQHMLDFKIDESDEAWMYTEHIWYGVGKGATFKKILNGVEAEYELPKDGFPLRKFGTDLKKFPLEICAPLKDFDLENYEVKDFKLSIPDPVVLKPVAYKGNVYYLIVTAWGDEASDELVVNERFN